MNGEFHGEIGHGFGVWGRKFIRNFKISKVGHA
jgi:hypothetical protein